MQCHREKGRGQGHPLLCGRHQTPCFLLLPLHPVHPLHRKDRRLAQLSQQHFRPAHAGRFVLRLCLCRRAGPRRRRFGEVLLRPRQRAGGHFRHFLRGRVRFQRHGGDRLHRLRLQRRLLPRHDPRERQRRQRCDLHRLRGSGADFHQRGIYRRVPVPDGPQHQLPHL